jgi:hypothetical protein
VKTLAIILLFGTVLFGCKPASRPPAPPKLQAASPILFDRVLAREDFARRLKEAEQDLAADEWQTNPMSGRFNYSRFKRIGPISEDVLHEVEPQLAEMDAGELLAQLKTFPQMSKGGEVDSATAAYFIYVAGNRKIIAFLDKRPKSEFEALRKFKDDSNETFAGEQGGPMSVGELIQLHLDKK